MNFLLFALVFAAALAVPEEDPHILCYKNLEADYLGQYQNFTVTYTVYNVGGATAYNVTIEDQWQDTAYNLLEGEFPIHFDEVLPGTNQTYNVTLSSNQMGYVDTVRALVTYYFSDTEGAESKVALSSYLGVLPFLNPQQYEQVTANYMREWIIYGIIVGVLTLLPYMIASSLSKNLNQVSAGKKKRN